MEIGQQVIYRVERLPRVQEAIRPALHFPVHGSIEVHRLQHPCGGGAHRDNGSSFLFGLVNAVPGVRRNPVKFLFHSVIFDAIGAHRLERTRPHMQGQKPHLRFLS